MHIRDYMIREAKRISNRELPVFTDQNDREAWRIEKQRVFHSMLGIDRFLKEDRTPLSITVTGTVSKEDYFIEKLHYQSLPGLYVAANLYVPYCSKNSPAPAIIYVCGHSKTQKIQYQDHPRRLAQLGFVVLTIDTVQFGETFGVHHGTYSNGWFHWISKGYSPAAIETWNAIRGLDLLEERMEVNRERMGITGHSGGGIVSWWLAIADDRIKAAASSSGTGTTLSHIEHKTLDGHCDCYFPSNPYGWSILEMYAVAAPKPMLIVSPSRDILFHIDSVREVYQGLCAFYGEWGEMDALGHFEFEGPHSYSSSSRQAVFSWMMKHLMGEVHDPEGIEDIDGFREQPEVLEVFQGKPPGNDRSTSVQDWFIPLSERTMYTTKEQHQIGKNNLVSELRKHTFAAFSENPAIVRITTEQSFHHNGEKGEKFSYESEEGLKLWGEWRKNENAAQGPHPTAICLRSPGDRKGQTSMELLNGLSEKWMKVRLDVRGTGDTAWGQELDWHVRRACALLLGKTVASMRVWDVLQGLAALRKSGEVGRVLLAGEGEMAVVVLFAALLDGGIDTVVLKNPPPSLNVPGHSDGSGPNFELIQALRMTDLAQASAFLWPTKLVFVSNQPGVHSFIGGRPDNYLWTEEQYGILGEPGGIWRLTTLANWHE